MKKILGIIAILGITVTSVSANAGLLEQVVYIFCQGPNSSTLVNFEKNTVTRQRFSSETATIRNITRDEEKGLISFNEVDSTGRHHSKKEFKVVGQNLEKGQIYFDMMFDGQALTGCIGLIK